jgi:hypothetical protein
MNWEKKKIANIWVLFCLFSLPHADNTKLLWQKNDRRIYDKERKIVKKEREIQLSSGSLSRTISQWQDQLRIILQFQSHVCYCLTVKDKWNKLPFNTFRLEIYLLYFFTLFVFHKAWKFIILVNGLKWWTRLIIL